MTNQNLIVAAVIGWALSKVLDVRSRAASSAATSSVAATTSVASALIAAADDEIGIVDGGMIADDAPSADAKATAGGMTTVRGVPWNDYTRFDHVGYVWTGNESLFGDE